MGFFTQLFGSTPTQAKIAKQVAKVKERYSQPDYRRAAMDKLLEWNTRESLEGVMQRFGAVVQSPHWDEEEKRWLVDELAKRGELAKNVIQNYLLSSPEVTHAALALDKLCDREEVVGILVGALKARSPEDYRSSHSKLELIVQLGEREFEEKANVLLPYLHDHNDDVQCMVLDVLAQHQLSQTYPQIEALLHDTTQSARVLRHAAGYAAKLQLPIKSDLPLAPEVVEDFDLKGGVLVGKRGK